MLNNDFNDECYLNWIINILSNGNNIIFRYTGLLSTLHKINFVPTHNMDVNRLEDGIDLRKQFMHDYDGFNYSSCSMLEMMAALAIKIEQTTMYDPSKGDRTWLWFLEMIQSLGLDRLVGDYIPEKPVYDAIDILNRREYCPNGIGGLFITSRKDIDMRNYDIWYQMQIFLTEYDENELSQAFKIN